MKSPIEAPTMTYLLVSLKDGERWTYQPPAGHDVAWVAVSDGLLQASSPIGEGEMAIFERSGEPIEFIADGWTRFVIGSARRRPQPLVRGEYSVHTSQHTLRQAEAEIRRIGDQLRKQGKRSYALQRY